MFNQQSHVTMLCLSIYSGPLVCTTPNFSMKPLSSEKTLSILSLLDSGSSVRQIATLTGASIGAISALRSEHRPNLPKSLGGRPSKLSSIDIRHAQRLISSGKAENAVQIARTLNDISNHPISVQTVRRSLKSAGLKALTKKKMPFLSKRHRRERMDFAVAHKDWTVEDWKRVVWSDETKINRLGSDGKKWVWKRPGENRNGVVSDKFVEGTMKFGGGSVMIWGCMMWEGAGYACKIDGNMDKHLYTSILEDELQASLDQYGKTPKDVIFQQDGDPKHRSGKAMGWLEDHGFDVMVWPPQSPDLNPIKHLWDYLKRRLGEYERSPAGVLELWERVEKEWNEIPASVCQKLIESMPRRVTAVLKAKGGHTKY